MVDRGEGRRMHNCVRLFLFIPHKNFNIMEHSTKLVIENHQLERAGYTAYIYYSIVTPEVGIFEENLWAVIESKEEHQDLLGRPYNKIDRQFTSTVDAIDWLTKKGGEIVVEELNVTIMRGKLASEQLEEIRKEGFKL